MDCPECTADVLWLGGTQVSPEAVRSTYLCPAPDCEVTTVMVVVEE
jgi:hypothetical protein